MRCLARGDMTNLVDSLLISLTRSLRRALIDPLTIEDMKLLADSVLEPKSLSLVGKLVTENQMAGISRAHTGRTNFDKATLAIEAAGYAFADLGELLEHVDRIVVDHPGCVKQVRMMLYSIFTRHQQLLETHARAIAYATQRVSYCPVEALPIIASMLRSSIEMGLATPTSKGYYGMALIFLANLDLENANVEQLLEAISLLGDICKLAPSALKDVLETFTSLSEHVSSCDNERKDVVVQAILDASLQFVENTNDYGPQLELVAFFEALEKQRIFLPKKACGILIAKASGLSLINRVCGILLRQEEENNEDVDEEMVTNVKERIWQWYPLGKEKKKRTQVQDVIRLEQPNVYSYITSRHTSGEAPIVL
ncbi:hypothetical protein BIW11_02439 [Tropilaelaps mercedesae]|uniref:Uncharacterized protein n=1 Tax=Tropilaelaps mercedesae TaxID=418985 RepID=A0A1V9Y344_9ACAR|nr:hypothetical protein BIW11_02439 [Tropilaelaps mercedesae]